MKIEIFMYFKTKYVLNDGEQSKIGSTFKKQNFQESVGFDISSVSSRKCDCLPIQCSSNFKPIILNPFEQIFFVYFQAVLYTLVKKVSGTTTAGRRVKLSCGIHRLQPRFNKCLGLSNFLFSQIKDLTLTKGQIMSECIL